MGPEINEALHAEIHLNVIHNSWSDKLQEIRQSIDEKGLNSSASFCNKHAFCTVFLPYVPLRRRAEIIPRVGVGGGKGD